jgi:3-oxoadipate enol-lactonase
VKSVSSNGTEIFFDISGSGRPVVLLHPFPLHGDSGLGDGPATMAKHAADIARVMTAAGIDRAPLIGVSIGGYILFEFWRQFRERVSSLVLCNTKAGADSPEARAGRLQAAEDVLRNGTEVFFEGMLQKVLGETTRRSRPDLVDGALRMMRKMSPEDVAGVQRGMADRPDSVRTAETITVPTSIITGDEDTATGIAEAEIMKKSIRGSEMKVVAKAGHYSPWERPGEVGPLLRNFLDSLSHRA